MTTSWRTRTTVFAGTSKSMTQPHPITAFAPTRQGPMITALLAITYVPARAEDVPRYQLSVGQEIQYQGTSDFKYESGSFHTDSNWTAWVVRQNADGSWRVVLKRESKFTQSAGGRSLGGQTNTSLAWFDLFPDGKAPRNDSLGFSVEPTVVFAKLPRLRSCLPQMH